MGNFSSFFNEQTCHTLQQLVLWKDTRIVPSGESIIDEQPESEDETVMDGNNEPVISNTDIHSTENDSSLTDKTIENN